AAVWAELEALARDQLASEGFHPERMRFRRAANIHYKGQIYELTVPAPDGAFDAGWVAALEEAFGREHETTYGHRAGPEELVELVNAQIVGEGLHEAPRVPEKLTIQDHLASRPTAPRRAYFGLETGWLE